MTIPMMEYLEFLIIQPHV